MELITRLEEIILISIWRLKNNAYGVTINKEVSERSRKKYSMGALYFTLDQLARKGFLVKREGDPTPKRGGKRKIFYEITPDGEKALQHSLEMHDSLWDDNSKFAFKKH
jgi:PadR family transcriptional regulator, regulatory protein PadR